MLLQTSEIMDSEIIILIITAASIGFFHTLLGPDHYVPFIVMAKARKWSLIKTSWITALSGLGHVGSSVLLGFVGIAFGIGISKLQPFESVRGSLAAWLFIAFGLVYFIWGVQKAIKNKPHKHKHFHEDGSSHSHEHCHSENHVHVHTENKKNNITPWVLFTIFFLGPCEPLIPILMYPAAKESSFGLIAVIVMFSIVTIATMLAVVLITSFGVNLLPLKRLERYTHAFAGGERSLES